MNYIVKSYLIKSIFPAIFAALATGLFNYYFIQQDVTAFIFGNLMGLCIYTSLYIYSNFYHIKIARNVPIIIDLMISTGVIVITIIFWVTVILLAFYVREWSSVLPYLKLLYNSPGVAMGLTYGIVISFAFNIFISVQEIIGSRTLVALFFGIYSIPREEKRIFMFLDIKSSTSVAEKLGNKQFLNMLNDFFFFSSEAISQTKGSIYKYVGDEIIISWPEKKGIRNANALRCFFLINESIKKRKSYFLKKYGVFPDFKAGMHAGKIIAGEIGFKKKEITFLGDVLNTTARIEGVCNEFNKRFLFSSEVKQLFENTTSFDFQKVAEINLRGKQHKTSIYTAI